LNRLPVFLPVPGGESFWSSRSDGRALKPANCAFSRTPRRKYFFAFLAGQAGGRGRLLAFPLEKK
jgi:hypothetical protein